jgi:hypothetical protein
MGAAGSIEVYNQVEVQNQDEGDIHEEASFQEPVLPRVIVRIDTHQQRIFCTKQELTKAHHCFSHRWENRENCLVYTVECDDGEIYECKLTSEEATNIEGYVGSLGPGLWLDYVCINQNNDSDKVAQVSIMGNIYLNGTTVTVGYQLRPSLPPMDYLIRAWCLQERFFGASKYIWDMESLDLESLIKFAHDSTERMSLRPCSLFIEYTHEPEHEWRRGPLIGLAKTHPQTAPHIDMILRTIHDKRDDALKRKLAITFLQIRQLIPYDHVVDPFEWNMLMFDCQASIQKDRLYGVWGVPFTMKKMQLDYCRPDLAWNSIEKHYPEAAYAFYAPSWAPDQPFNGFSGFASVKQVVLNMLEYQQLRPGTHTRMPTNIEKITFQETNDYVNVVWDDKYIAVVWDANKSQQMTTCRMVCTKDCVRRGVGAGGEGGACQKYMRVINAFLNKVGGNFHHWTNPFDLKGAMERICQQP